MRVGLRSRIQEDSDAAMWLRCLGNPVSPFLPVVPAGDRRGLNPVWDVVRAVEPVQVSSALYLAILSQLRVSHEDRSFAWSSG